jgi:foldase protein PrsA
MGEGNRTTAGTLGKSPKQKLVLVGAGTAVAVLAAAVLLQVLRAEPGEAQVERAAPAGDRAAEAGHSSVSQRQPLARVGRQLISYEEVAQECVERYGKDILDQIINRTIIQQACVDRNITVTEAEVDKEIMTIAQKFKLTPEQWYQMLQAERNLTPLQYRRDIIWPMLALKRLAGTKISVDQKDIDMAFERDFGPKVKARMIMLDNFRRANEVWEQAVKNPQDFERLVQQHSIEPNSKALGGAIPPIRRHAGNDNLENAAFRLRKGEISPIVQVGPQIQPRFVILLCEGRTEKVVDELDDELYQQLYVQLMEEKTQEAVASIFDQLKKEARVDNYLTNTSSGGMQQTSGTRPSEQRNAAPPRTAGNPKPTTNR